MSTDTTVDTIDTGDTDNSVVAAPDGEKKPARTRKPAAKKTEAAAEPEVTVELVLPPPAHERGFELDTDPVHDPVPSIKPEQYVADAFAATREEVKRARTQADQITLDAADMADRADVLLCDPDAMARAEEAERQGQHMALDLSTVEGFAIAKEQQEKFRQLRLANDRVHARYKEPFLRLGKMIDKTRNEIKEQITEYEERFAQAIAREEARREAEREKLVKAEQERVAALRLRVEGLRAAVVEAYGMPAADVRALIATVEAVVIDDSWAEYAELATQAKTDALRALGAALAAAERTEAQLAELSRYRDQFGPIAALPEADGPAAQPMRSIPGMAAPLDDAVINRALAIALFMSYRCLTGQSRDAIGAVREARRMLLRAGYTPDQLGLEAAA